METNMKKYIKRPYTAMHVELYNMIVGFETVTGEKVSQEEVLKIADRIGVKAFKVPNRSKCFMKEDAEKVRREFYKDYDRRMAAAEQKVQPQMAEWQMKAEFFRLANGLRGLGYMVEARVAKWQEA